MSGRQKDKSEVQGKGSDEKKPGGHQHLYFILVGYYVCGTTQNIAAYHDHFIRFTVAVHLDIWKRYNEESLSVPP